MLNNWMVLCVPGYAVREHPWYPSQVRSGKRALMKMTMSSITCGQYDVLLWLHTKDDPPGDEWAKAMEVIEQVSVKRGGDTSNIRSIVLSDGGAPNALQRQEVFVKYYKGEALTVAVTNALNNRIKRGVATAISWINPAFRALPPSQFLQAVEYLGLSEYTSVILSHYEELQRELPEIQTLTEILEAQRA